MAMSISLMFARFGSTTGSNVAALLLNDHCEVTFYLAGSILIGNWLHRSTLFFICDKCFEIIYSGGCTGVFHSKHPQEKSELKIDDVKVQRFVQF